MKLKSVQLDVSQWLISSLNPEASLNRRLMSSTADTSHPSMVPKAVLAELSSDSHNSTALRSAARLVNAVGENAGAICSSR